ncbi:unnamed protein product [Ranitomeya imitator]|uniref:Transposase n=1 Tax=Ranitomeya imitator TaxID=111125 RepID=A0ABN9KUI1_9NEOB|nr:unnamed protein product [Ranitomeya imitator]
MGKTSDLTDVKKAIIDTLKQEGKTQKEISQQIGCSQSAVSRHLNGKSVGRKQCGRKRCTTRRGDRTLRKIVEKDRFQTLGNLRKQWTESGVETSRATVHRRVQEMGYRCRIPQVKPLLNHKQRQRRLTWATEKQHWTVAKWSQVLFSDESKFCMSFGNQGARVWRKTGEKEMPKCLKSSVKYPQSVMVWGAMSAAGVGPLCFIKGRVNAASYQEILEHFMLPSAEMLYGDEDFIFQHDLAPAHSAKTTGKWFTDHGITVLNWPANSPDLNPIENLWDIVKRKLRDARPNTLDELKAAIEASWASITSQQCHRLIASMPRRIEAVISAKGFPTKLALDGAPIIAIHKARYYKKKDGLALGPGPFVTALEYATDTKAIVVGKPEKTFFLEALRSTDCCPEEAVMIGDDCRDDIGGAQDTGMLGILVKTGKYRIGDESRITPAPHLTCADFPQAVDHILKNLL